MSATTDQDHPEPQTEATPPAESLLWGAFLCVLGLFLLVFLVSDDFRVLATSPFDIGPRAVPGAIGAAVLAGGIWEVIAQWRAWRGIAHRVRLGVTLAKSDSGLLHAYGLLGLLATYLIGLPWIGFSLGSLLMAMLIMVKLGQRWWVGGLVALGLIVVIKILFTKLFEVPLPEGLLDGLFGGLGI